MDEKEVKIHKKEKAAETSAPEKGAPVPQEPKAEKRPPAEPSDFKERIWTPLLYPIVALLAICLVTSLLLGITNNITEPLIEQNTQAAADEARRQLLPQAEGFVEMELTTSVENVTSMYSTTNDVGYVIEAYGQGYGGQVPAMVAFSEEGDVVGVTFLENSETPGLGQKLVTEPAFAAQFAGLPSETIGLGDVEKIASATISTGAAVNAINAAIQAYNEVVGGVSASLTEEEVRESLLPGRTLTAITIAAENVQPTAWRSDAGEYIIYGEKPSDREGSDAVTVAAVAVDGNGVILNIWIDTSGDSPQYGATLMQNRAFLESFIGKTAPVEVDVVANITNSSRSVMSAVNSALDALPLAKEAA